MSIQKPRRVHDYDNVLRYIEFHCIRYGNAPTLREIMRECEISSTSVVSHIVDVLIAQGKLYRTAAPRRNIRPTRPGFNLTADFMRRFEEAAARRGLRVTVRWASVSCDREQVANGNGHPLGVKEIEEPG